MVLQSPLDGKKKLSITSSSLLLMEQPSPFRNPPIRVQVVDANDNPPAFTSSVPHECTRTCLWALGCSLVKATDPDEGANGEVTYSFHNIDHKMAQIFHLDSYRRNIRIKNTLDF